MNEKIVYVPVGENKGIYDCRAFKVERPLYNSKGRETLVEIPKGEILEVIV